jgi:hypothetical protein
MRKNILVLTAIVGLGGAPAVLGGAEYELTTRAGQTLGIMFTQSGAFGPPPYAADPFPCTAAVTAKRSMYYNTVSNTILFCNGTVWGSLGGGGVTSPITGDFVATGKWTFGSAADAAGSVRLGETANCIVIEGTGADAHETNICATNPTADVTFSTPDATAGSYALLTSAAAVTLAQGGTGLTTAADDTVPVSSGTAYVATALPDCDDSAGNHLNYDTTTNAFSCGTSAAVPTLFTARTTFGSAADAANSVDLNETAGQITFEGSGADGNETRLAVTNPTGDRVITLPNETGTVVTSNSTVPFAVDVSLTVGKGLFANSSDTGYGGIYLQRGDNQTPGGFFLLTGKSVLANSIRIKEAADIGSDTQNGYCGTSSCTDPTLTIFSHNSISAEYLSLLHDGANALLDTGTGSVVVRAGTGTGRARVSGTLSAASTAVGNITTGADDLMTYALPAASLVTNNEGVEIHAWGTTANTANAKTLICYFGATAIQTTSLTTSIAGVWDIRATVLRTGATGQVAISTNSTQGAAGIALVDVESTTPGETLSGAVTIKCTGEGTDTDDIVQRGLVIDYLN